MVYIGLQRDEATAEFKKKLRLRSCFACRIQYHAIFILFDSNSTQYFITYLYVCLSLYIYTAPYQIDIHIVHHSRNSAHFFSLLLFIIFFYILPLAFFFIFLFCFLKISFLSFFSLLKFSMYYILCVNIL